MAAWGTARDYALIKRLKRRFPSLGGWLKRENLVGGQGFQEAGSSTPTPEEFLKLRVLRPEAVTRYQIIDEKLVEDVPPTMHRPRKDTLYRGPLLLTTRGIKSAGFLAAFSSDDVLYNEMFFGIVPTAGGSTEALHYLNAVLNSSVARYFLFLTGSSWGVERDEIKPNELKELPVPPIPRGDSELLRRILVLESRLRELIATGASEGDLAGLREDLDVAVFDLYGFREAEIVLVRDFGRYTFDRWRRGSRSHALSRITTDQIKAYAKRVASGLRRILHTLDDYSVATEVLKVGSSPLAAVRFRLIPHDVEHRASKQTTMMAEEVEPQAVALSADAEERIEQLLRDIEHHGRVEIGYGIVSRRATRVYRQLEILVVKPALRREWTQSAALVDLDSIIAESVLGYSPHPDDGSAI